MDFNRKEFLKLGGQLTTGLMLTPFTSKLIETERQLEGKLKKFGLQLYTVRDDMARDPKGILKQIASFGYKQIESYEGPGGMFWGMTPSDFKKFLDDLGLEMIASHCDATKDFEKKAGEAASIGMKYLIYNWPPAGAPLEEFKKKVELFNRCGEICKKEGLRFANHNYSSSFQQIDGVFPQDLLMRETDASLVDYEMDIYWVVVGGQDPIPWLKKYPDRFRLCHIKDRIKGSTERDASCDLGTGSIAIPQIIKAAAKNGMQYFFAEQERYDNSTPMKSTKTDAEYMKRLRV